MVPTMHLLCSAHNSTGRVASSEDKDLFMVCVCECVCVCVCGGIYPHIVLSMCVFSRYVIPHDVRQDEVIYTHWCMCVCGDV